MNPRLRQRKGPRSLAAANVARLAEASETDLKPGHMRLYTNCVPSLQPGSYGIEVKQRIQTTRSDETGRLNVWNYDSTATIQYPPPDNTPVIKQKFDVVAPQFQLDSKAVRSHYPPDGFADDATVLPHIVFNDPHLPWMRQWAVRPNPQLVAPTVPVPWLALLVFTPDELRLDPSEAATLRVSDDSIKAATTSGAYPMSVGDYLSNVTMRPRYEEGFASTDDPTWIRLKSSEETTSVIFPKVARMAEMVSPVVKFILMAHVRELNTEGFPDAGQQDKGLFSVCVSPTTGKSDGQKPIPHVVHLVSIEHLGARIPGGAPERRMGLVSLYSWNYLVVPPNPINFKDTMIHLATTKAPLRPSQDILDAAASNSLLQERLSLGYSIARWRTSTGEETVAFSRGPLSPVRTPWIPVNDWPSSSNTGKDFQIIDTKLGVLDLTYSSAWQLGKLLAIADPVFSAALLRFRGLVHKQAASSTRIVSNSLATRRHITQRLHVRTTEIRSAASDSLLPARNILPTQDKVAPFLSHPHIRPVFLDALSNAVTSSAGAGRQFYNDYLLGSADNSDWETIHTWLSDKLFLGGIPCHYLITDPTHLPPESLRFFYIDAAWTDCFIDGALSISNHRGPENDSTRKIIKEVYNIYLQDTVQEAGIKPPVPRYGFLLRSELIRIMPDIRIVVRCRDASGNPDANRLPLVRLTKLNDSTLFALFDCMPEELFDIRFIQPPHQQKYVIPTQPRQLYSHGSPASTESGGEWGPIQSLRMPSEDQIMAWYSPSTQCLDVLTMYADLSTALPFGSPLFPGRPWFRFGDWPSSEGPIDSTIMALELNDVSYELTIRPPVNTGTATQPPRDRQLWMGDNAPASRRSRLSTRGLRTASFPSDALLWTEKAQSRFDPSILRPPTAQTKVPIISHRQTRRPPPATTTLSAALTTRSISLPTIRAITTIPIIPDANPQFRLTVYPSTRGAAPSPDTTTDPDSPVYSTLDYIPTDSPQYINLIFSLHRLPSTHPFPHRLSSIQITIPITTTASTTSPPPVSEPEPLLHLAPFPVYPLSARLIANRHLTTTLTRTPTSLQISLAPRAIPVTRTGSLPDAVTRDASFVLRMCDVAPIREVVRVRVRDAGGVRVEERGVCEVRVQEKYLLTDGSVGRVEGLVGVVKKGSVS